MPGAQKKRAAQNKKNERAKADQLPAPRGEGGYDGPSDRPPSSSGAQRPESSRGRPESSHGQVASQAGSQAASGGNRSAPGGPGVNPSGQQQLVSTTERPRLNPRIDWGGNAFNYYSNDSVSITLYFVLKCGRMSRHAAGPFGVSRIAYSLFYSFLCWKLFLFFNTSSS